MSEQSAIEWTDSTDNIIVAAEGGWWCRHVTPACDFCYAEKLNQSSYFHGNKLPYSGEPPVLKLREDIIDRWQRQRTPKKHFVASMTDIFGEWVPRSWIFHFLDGMNAAPRQTFQVLTKRPAIMRREVQAWLEARGLESVPPHIWLGASVGSQRDLDAFAPLMLGIPATRFLSVEPMLGPVDVGQVLSYNRDDLHPDDTGGRALAAMRGIDWVICGGESGTKARPMHPEWPRLLRDQCVAAGVPFFFKQWGEWYSVIDRDRDDHDWRLGYAKLSASPRHRVLNFAGGEGFHGERIHIVERIGKKKAGRLLDGQLWNQFPEISAN